MAQQTVVEQRCLKRHVSVQIDNSSALMKGFPICAHEVSVVLIDDSCAKRINIADKSSK